ncbi:MAG: EutN/CcmL family microcompartment protein [Candidatus Korobacteraceae bacterium]
MILARVVGEVVATHKHRSHAGRKILMVQPIHPDGSDRGEVVLALDSVDAGKGDQVLVVQEGFAAMTSVGRPGSPIDMSIVGVVDQIEMAPDEA